MVPVAPDLFNLQGLRNLGPTLRAGRDGWRKRLGELADPGRPLEVLPSVSATQVWRPRMSSHYLACAVAGLGVAEGVESGDVVVEGEHQ